MNEPAPSDQAPPAELSLLPPTAPPAPPADDAAVPPADDKNKMSEAEMTDLLGALYGDAFAALGSKYVGRPVELPEPRQAKRGRQLAAAFKALGWDDGQVILIVGLCAGGASDLVLLKSMKENPPALPPKEEEA